MTSFDSVPFIAIDNQPISIGQAFGYLQLFGRLQPFIQDVLRYHTIYQAIQTNPDLVVTTGELGQFVLDFRLKMGLTDPDNFQQWLSNQGVNYGAFESQAVIGLQLEKLKDQVAASYIDTYFAEHHRSFEQVDLYYIVTSEEALAYQIKERVAGGESFEQIARQYPLDAENLQQAVITKRDVLRRHQLREEIKTALETADEKVLVGPIVMGNRWCICQVEQTLPAVLDEQIRQELREQIFEQWVTEKSQQVQVTPVGQTAIPSEPETEGLPEETAAGSEEQGGSTVPKSSNELELELQPV